jgi:uncharacterized membrane protein (UPF0127 family)
MFGSGSVKMRRASNFQPHQRRAWGGALLSLWLATSSGALGCKTTASGEAQPPETTQRASRAAAQAARVELLPPGRDPLVVSVEVVDTPDARQRGLMYRKQLAPDAGMLFIFERPEHHSFWMHNTLIPLDMLFITADWTILGIVENATPLTDSPRSVLGDSQYVLEVNAGFARRHGLQAGTSLRYVPAVSGS